MTIKRVVLILVLVFLAGAITTGLRAQADHVASSNGRYVLSPGMYSLIGKTGASMDFHTVFRIDTATGKTWTYEAGQDAEGKLHVGWVVVTDPLR